MCGIAGVFWTGTRPLQASDIVTRMVSAIEHRGPDSEGRISNAFCEIGFRRLAIVDLARGDQPIGNEDGSVECFLNGEIYNYRELRTELEAGGHQFTTDSDTEVLPHLYEEFGLDMFRRLNGMFAVCIVDHRARQVVLARDHFGVKQMYYVRTPLGVAFASEVKALIASNLFEPRVEREGILAYLTLFYCPEPNTLLEGVKKLPPGNWLAVRAGGRVDLQRSFQHSGIRSLEFT